MSNTTILRFRKLNKRSGKVLILLAYLFKKLKLPHILKYLLFLKLKNKDIPVKSHLKLSLAKINLNLGNFIDYWIYVDESYEEKWLKKAQKLVKGKVFIDVGSHIGIYPLSLYKTTSFIYAFEPEERNYEKLLHNLEINEIKNVKVLRKAVFCEDEKVVKLYINNNDTGWHSLSIKYSNNIQKVTSVTLDNFINKNNIKNIGLIKIDIEGGEYNAIKGLQNTLKKFHPNLLVEFNKPFSMSGGHQLIDIYKLIANNHYLCFRLINRKLIKIDESSIEKVYNENLLFIYHE